MNFNDIPIGTLFTYNITPYNLNIYKKVSVDKYTIEYYRYRSSMLKNPGPFYIPPSSRISYEVIPITNTVIIEV